MIIIKYSKPLERLSKYYWNYMTLMFLMFIIFAIILFFIKTTSRTYYSWITHSYLLTRRSSKYNMTKRWLNLNTWQHLWILRKPTAPCVFLALVVLFSLLCSHWQTALLLDLLPLRPTFRLACAANFFPAWMHHIFSEVYHSQSYSTTDTCTVSAGNGK